TLMYLFRNWVRLKLIQIPRIALISRWAIFRGTAVGQNLWRRTNEVTEGIFYYGQWTMSNEQFTVISYQLSEVRLLMFNV
ncbi:MAG: hypothetical protein AAFU74_18380, partial [Bacteroidota bacterium]